MSGVQQAQREPSVPVFQDKREREKGLWSFLTWSFFLSQIAAAEAANAGATQSSATDPDAAATGAEGSGAAQFAALGPDASAGPSAEPDAGGGSDPFMLAPGRGVATQTSPGAPIDASNTVAVAGDTDGPLTMAIGSGGIAFASAAASGDGHPATDAPHPGGGAIDTDPHLPGPVTLPDLGLPDLLPDLVDTVTDTVHGLVDTLDNLLAPVTGLLDTALPLVGSVVEGVVTPVVAIADRLVSDLTGTVEHAVAPLLDGVGQITSSVLPGVTSVLGLGAHGAGNLVSGLLSPLTGGQQDAVASGGSISILGHASTGGDDQLFAGGQYTSYNMALTLPTSLGQTVGAVTDLLPLHALDGSHAADDPSAQSHTASAHPLPGILEELHLRGLGDGIVG